MKRNWERQKNSDNVEENAEAVVWRRSAAGSVENMFLEISQNSQENTCALFYIKLQPFREISKNTFFYQAPPVAASVGPKYKVKRISNSEWCECSTKAVLDRCSQK